MNLDKNPEIMKTTLIAIGNIIVIIFLISRIRIKMHFRFFSMNFTNAPTHNYFYKLAHVIVRRHIGCIPFPVCIVENVEFIN